MKEYNCLITYSIMDKKTGKPALRTFQFVKHFTSLGHACMWMELKYCANMKQGWLSVVSLQAICDSDFDTDETLNEFYENMKIIKPS